MIKLMPNVSEFFYRFIKKKYPEKIKPASYYHECIIAFDKEYNEIVKIPYSELPKCTFTNVSVEFELKRIQEGSEYKEQILINKVEEINPLTTLIEGSNVLLLTYLAHYRAIRGKDFSRSDYLKLRMYINVTLNYEGNTYNVTILESPRLSVWSMNTIKIKVDKDEVMPVLITDCDNGNYLFSIGRYLTRDLEYKNCEETKCE